MGRVQQLVVNMALVLIPMGLNAQVTLQYGPRIGLSFSSLAGKQVIVTSVPMNALLGIYGKLSGNKPFSVQAELVYVTGGSEFRLHGDSLNKNYKISLGYITLPIMAERELVRGFFVQGGCQAGVLLNAITDEASGTKTKNRSSLDGYNLFDYGPVLGLLYQFPFGLQAGLRGYRSMRTIDSRLNGKLEYNTFFQVILGYSFGRKMISKTEP